MVASGSWPFQVNLLQAQQAADRERFPTEGATGWADTTMMHAAGQASELRLQVAGWSLNPKAQGDVAAWFGSVPVVPAACKDNALLGAEGCKTNGIDNFDKIHFWRTPRSQVRDARSCVPYSRWATDYVAVMGGR